MTLDMRCVRAARERTAKRDVKLARIRAHDAFDVLWRDGYMSRSDAYDWLASEFDEDEVHMAQMTIEECERVVVLVRGLLDSLHDEPEETRVDTIDEPMSASEALDAFRKSQEGREQETVDWDNWPTTGRIR